MPILISEAAHCEHAGAYGYESGHQPGNQTGDELRTIPYYNLPWKYVLRCRNKDIREAVARRCYIATQNMNIGYSQPGRYGLLGYLKSNVDVCDIKEKTDCDCSSLQSGVAWYTLKTQGITSTITGRETTSSMYDAYMRSGWYDDVTNQVNLVTGAGLVMGDVLLTPGKHTAIVYSAGNATPKWVGECIVQNTRVYTSQDKKTVLSVCPLLGIGNLVDVCDETASMYYVRIKGSFGYVEKSSIKKHQRVGKTVTALNLRTAPVSGSILKIIPQGATVTINSESRIGSDTWYGVTYSGTTGYASGKYIVEA